MKGKPRQIFPSVLQSLKCSLAICALAACSAPRATAGTIQVEIRADGESFKTTLAPGSTVQEAITQTGIYLGELDRVEPPSYTLVTDGTQVTITRIVEKFEIEQVVIPFERQTIRNESLPEGETRLLQPGENGTEEITYRIVEEEGLEVARSPVKRVVVLEPQPEVVMIGAQVSYSPVSVTGSLAYESGGNAWLIRGDTGGRRPLVISGDLDGYIFKLSADSRWLLYSRQEEDEDTINSLWVVSTTDSTAKPFPLRIENVVHFADWSPTPPLASLAYSTVEPSPAAPGWQANNDLHTLTFSSSGRILTEKTLLEPNAGGQYGWWGTTYAWSPNGRQLAYARADSVGIIDLREPELSPALELTPFQTLGDWAWVPGVAWGRGGRTLYLVDHGPPLGLGSPEASQVFDLVAYNPEGDLKLLLSPRSGMFAYPSISPAKQLVTGEIAYRVSFLQAMSPLDSQTSSYRLLVMDKDGSNRRSLFPAEGDPGIEPPEQAPVWSPDGERLAFVHRGDLWVVDADRGVAQRLSADGLTGAFDWKP